VAPITTTSKKVSRARPRTYSQGSSHSAVSGANLRRWGGRARPRPSKFRRLATFLLPS
jgi:hypothetical protein